MSENEFKQVLVVRADLDVSVGKLGAQFGHAAVGAAMRAHEQVRLLWLNEGQLKVVLEAPDVEALEALISRAKELSQSYYLVRDAGRTELEPLTPTVLGIGPGPMKAINRITGQLPLLKGFWSEQNPETCCVCGTDCGPAICHSCM